MKRVASISLGSSKRNHQTEIELMGEQVAVERIGTDGDLRQARALIEKLDGTIDCFGLGGIDLYIRAGNRRYTIRDARRLKEAAHETPVVDGSGLKDSLERMVVDQLQRKGHLDLQNRTVLLVSGLDRFGLAEALEELGGRVIYGDVLYTIGLPLPLYSLSALTLLARLAAPLACLLPFHVLYPTGKKQESSRNRGFQSRYFQEADIIAGDFHFIRRYMPEDLKAGKVILTNTVTAADKEFLRQRRVELLITTTPEFEGRSFGTNVMEALLVALSGIKHRELTRKEYTQLLRQFAFAPCINKLNSSQPQSVFRSQKQPRKV